MTRHRKLILFLAVMASLSICGGVVLVNTRAFQVRYHNWRMKQAWQQRYSNPSPPTGDGLISYSPGDAQPRYEYHRQKLVELGDVAERHYAFKHLQVPTRESKHFTRLLLSDSCPSCIDFASPYPNKPEPMQLVVWCRPADAKAWDEFVAKYDVSDYRERFMAGEKESAAK
ncbi:MAG: hypothetical protein LLF97_05780 [Planctomycetaceae bacterium]|nr:hypothetical protein [Planctomycetaceae bacterium]